MRQDKRNKIKVGDMVVRKEWLDTAKPCEVLCVDGEELWIKSSGCSHKFTGNISNYQKVPDIRTISCADGAIIITGEFVKGSICGNDICVRTSKPWIGRSGWWGKDITDTLSDQS